MAEYIKQKIQGGKKSICDSCTHRNVCKAIDNQPCTECNHYQCTADVEPVQEWISVKERLPQENEPEGTLCENVQVLLNNGKVSVGWCNRRTKLWWHMEYDEDYFISKDYDHTPVIAWQPLAQPPKGELLWLKSKCNT